MSKMSSFMDMLLIYKSLIISCEKILRRESSLSKKKN